MKNVFLTLSARDHYPTMTNHDLAELLNDAKLLDDYNLSFGIFDIEFISARTDADKRGFKLWNQNYNEINRLEFLEVLVRITGILK